MRLAAALAVVATGLALAGLAGGCGGAGTGSAPPAPQQTTDQVAEARAYTAQVQAATEKARADLAGVSAAANYRDGQAAQTSTLAYAAAIRAAAKQLASAPPPANIKALHQSLVTLYTQTADRMQALAARFALATTPTQLTALAEELSAEVQRYSVQENQLRSSIEAALAKVLPTTPAAPSTPSAVPPAGSTPAASGNAPS